MTGIVFVEFLDMVETKFGIEMVDALIDESQLQSKGIYTAVGTYSFDEMLQLVVGLSNKTEVAVPDLLKVFAHHFFTVIERDYAPILKSYQDPMEMLSSIENHIHVQVRKIYPDAELPRFEVLDRDENSMKMMYYSDRGLYMFACGLMEKTFEYFGEPVTISMDLVEKDGTKVLFNLTTT